MKFKTSSFRCCRLLGIAFISISALAGAQDKEAPKQEPGAAEKKPALTAEEVKTSSSYYFGYNTGMDFSGNVSRFGLKSSDLDTENFTKGFFDAFNGDESGLTQEQLQAAMQALGDMLQEREKKLAEKNKAAAVEFLAQNAKKKGMITTESGLQYEVLQEGGDVKYTAPKDPQVPQKVFKVHYKGTLIDGTQFDASPPNQAVPMTLQVVPGFREALTSMSVGAKWKLYLSPELAYGEARRSAEIEPNSLLIFELELTSIEDAPQQQQGLPFQLPQGR